MNTTATLALHQLSFERDDEYLFQNINHSLKNGELLQIKGANGSGKSTLLRILAGLIEPRGGDVFWQGKSIQEQSLEYNQHLLYLGHQHGIKPFLTIKENMRLFAAIYKLNITEASLIAAIEHINLAHVIDQPASFLSAGQTRRLALTRFLLKPATIWLLDEPMTALDQQGQSLLHSLLDKHTEEGGIAIVATHQELRGHVIELGKKTGC